MPKILLAIVISFLACFASAEWAVIGAGNATCENWVGANQNKKAEILSWMTGFSSAQNLNFVSENQPGYRLELLTYDYLTNTINDTCTKSESSNESMSGILFQVLTDFPRESAK
ncbi:hypothetical protein [Sedimenticola selenatireducens]|uniref:hypothetical protein n=1 Tax=Sedimenticola selenatireducens TaxID=191960 RepID=UPI0012F82E47|nr:hypothetical protein [Sedimenticola selenatireducens]